VEANDREGVALRGGAWGGGEDKTKAMEEGIFGEKKRWEEAENEEERVRGGGRRGKGGGR
jgi:hypothetical protein